MAIIMVKYDTVSKKMMMESDGMEMSDPLDSISFGYRGKDDEGNPTYGCDMSSFSKDKENDMYKMERMYCSENPEILNTAKELLTKFYTGR